MGMTDTTVAATVAARVAEVRNRRGYKLRELSRRLADLGYSMDPSALMRLERGERKVTLDDVMALALALDVSPDALAIPLDDGRQVAVTKNVVHPAHFVRDWFTGTSLFSLPGEDEDAMLRRFEDWQSERPLTERWARKNHPSLFTLLDGAEAYIRFTVFGKNTGERRRALLELQAEVERQIASLDREES